MEHISSWSMVMMFNILGENINTMKKNIALLHYSKYIPVEVNAEQSKYMFMSCLQNTGRNHDLMMANKYFQSVARYKYLGMTATNHSIHEEIKGRLNSGSVCYHSVKNLLSVTSLRT
jgi:hypothetical protein